MEPQGTIRVRIEEDLSLFYNNLVFQELLARRAEMERLVDLYPYEPYAIGQDIKDPSIQHFSAAKGLEATKDC
ncbi:unnamed protein product [Heligmosomoides polygyrus]|uniref:Polyphosphate kinase n=1 Tax=Heligmosomoides polygyrus TaxID=6339 RepID=A0A183FNG5_HELPZ|nr:unnamed protein product [Heligmosomoides polygyrus]